MRPEESRNPDLRKLAAAISPTDGPASDLLWMMNKSRMGSLMWGQSGQLSSAGKDRLISTLAGALDLKPLPHTGLSSGSELVSAIMASFMGVDKFSYQGSDTSSCVASVLERQLLLGQADTYARLAIELLTSGKSMLPDGTELLSEPVDFTVQEGRTTVSDALQEAFLRAASALDEAARDAAASESFGGVGRKSARSTFGGTRPKASKSGFAGNEGGMSAEAAVELREKLTGRPQRLVSDPVEMHRILNQVGGGVGHYTNFVTLMKPTASSDGVGHAVHLEKWSVRSGFDFVDPSGPASQLGTNGFFRLNMEQLVSAAAHLIVPADWVDPPGSSA